jgi:hypothetical protein
VLRLGRLRDDLRFFLVVVPIVPIADRRTDASREDRSVGGSDQPG